MKKTLLSRRNALLTQSSLPLGASVVAIAVVVVLMRALFPGALVAIAAPALRAGAAASAFATGLRASFTDTATLVAERNALRSQIDVLTNQNLALAAQITDLTKLMSRGEAEPQGIIAGILARPPQTGYDSLLVGAGTTAGVSSGMRAFVGSVPVGVVASVTSGSARVALYTSPGSVLAAWGGDARVALTLTGKGGGAFSATAPKEAPLQEGDVIYATGPGALPIGRIEAIETDAASPSATLRIEPLVNLFSITWVKLVP